MNNEEKITQIWQKYEAGRNQHRASDMYKNTERCHRFYEGEQWYGLQSGGEELPVLNFVRPICTYKIATVAMNTTAIIYSSFSQRRDTAELCTALNGFAATLWEKNKLEKAKWEIVKNACISGDAYLYSFDERTPTQSVKRDLTPRIKTRVIDKAAVYFADEQNPDINEQEWIIIAERVSVAAVLKLAEKNGIQSIERAKILSDEADETNVGVSAAHEVKTDCGKCTSLLFMRKTSKGIEFCRSVRQVIYQPMQLVPGLCVYPLCGMRWLPKMGSARGAGVVQGLIANQIEVNRTIARRALMVKKQGYSSMIVDPDKIENPEALGKIGSIIHVRNLSQNPISSFLQYLTPAPISGDASALQNEIISLTKELEGASNAATGQVNPERASGEAIKAARDQSVLSLTEQSAAYKQFCEDLAEIWYRLWVCYAASGIELTNSKGEKRFYTQNQLKNAEIDIKIDISPSDPYSTLSREMALENALSKGHISFEEYVQTLDAGTSVPKDKFNKILQERSVNAKEDMGEEISPELISQILNAGGEGDAMPYL